jgi:hypothetical protein
MSNGGELAGVHQGGELTSVPNTAAPELCYDIPRLLLMFEGLGDNCDFGVIQRAVGIEPFGLFRFAACKPKDVGALLRTRFQCLGEPEDLWLDEVGPRREYWVKSRQSSFEAHTERYADTDAAEVVRAALIEKIRFLKTRLIRDLSRGRRLCVWRGAADMKAIQEIAAQLQTYAPTCLLWVKVAGAAQRPGTVERVSDGLLLGFLSRYGDYDGGPRPPVEEWINVCANAYRLWRGADPPKAPLENLIARAMATHTCRWFGDRSVETRLLDEAPAAGGAVYEHRLGGSDATTAYGTNLPIGAGGNFAFSAWVRVPEGFRGRRISAILPGYAGIAQWTADPKSYARWQRIWVTATLPEDAPSISCEITAEGEAGDVFQSASWCLERGNRPLGYGYTL